MSILTSKSMDFAIRIVNLFKFLAQNQKEYILSKQLLPSGTSIGANIREATQAQSKPDFISKLSIALKEAVETSYWIELMAHTDYITHAQAISINTDCTELIKLLTASINTAKKPT